MVPATSEENFRPRVTEAVSFVTSAKAGVVELVQKDVWPIASAQTVRKSATVNLQTIIDHLLKWFCHLSRGTRIPALQRMRPKLTMAFAARGE
jgi:hypothetical protein